MVMERKSENGILGDPVEIIGDRLGWSYRLVPVQLIYPQPN